MCFHKLLPNNNSIKLLLFSIASFPYMSLRRDG